MAEDIRGLLEGRAVRFVEPVAASCDGHGECMGARTDGSSISGSNLVLQLSMETVLDIDLKMEKPPTPANGRSSKSCDGTQAAGEAAGSPVRTAEDRASIDSS
jgi:hypothetical protein